MSLKLKNILLNELENRKSRNPQYSLRAFSRDLGIGLGSLSEVLADKRNLSKKNIQKVLTILNVDLQTKDNILDKNKKSSAGVTHQLMLEDQLRLISDWYYLAILNLAKLKNNKADPVWVASRLGIERYQAQEATKRLTRLGLIKTEKNRLVRTVLPITTSQDIPSTVIRKHHQQNLLLAEKSLIQDDVKNREFGSVTMTVDMKNLPKVKELLLKTRKSAAKLLEKGQPTQVYTLSFQLFPVTRVDKND